MWPVNSFLGCHVGPDPASSVIWRSDCLHIHINNGSFFFMPRLSRYTWLMNIALFIFFHVEENGTKRRRPCPAYSCASPKRTEHAETPPPFGGVRQSARFFLSISSMLGAGQRGKLNSERHPDCYTFRSFCLGGWLYASSGQGYGVFAFHLTPGTLGPSTPSL